MQLHPPPSAMPHMITAFRWKHKVDPQNEVLFWPTRVRGTFIMLEFPIFHCGKTACWHRLILALVTSPHRCPQRDLGAVAFIVAFGRRRENSYQARVQVGTVQPIPHLGLHT